MERSIARWPSFALATVLIVYEGVIGKLKVPGAVMVGSVTCGLLAAPSLIRMTELTDQQREHLSIAWELASVTLLVSIGLMSALPNPRGCVEWSLLGCNAVALSAWYGFAWKIKD